jgi:hypothetical protein
MSVPSDFIVAVSGRSIAPLRDRTRRCCRRWENAWGDCLTASLLEVAERAAIYTMIQSNDTELIEQQL